MRYKVIVVQVFIAAVYLAACATPLAAPRDTSNSGEDVAVRATVEGFGKRLQAVALLSPDVGQQIRDQYSAFVSSALLEEWVNDPSKAPGRLVSSPWPDRIEITALAADGAGRYTVSGVVVEVTSVEMVSGGAAAETPVRLLVENVDGRWLITQYRKG